jgi:hypothetical protein
MNRFLHLYFFSPSPFRLSRDPVLFFLDPFREFSGLSGYSESDEKRAPPRRELLADKMVSQIKSQIAGRVSELSGGNKCLKYEVLIVCQYTLECVPGTGILKCVFRRAIE